MHSSGKVGAKVAGPHRHSHFRAKTQVSVEAGVRRFFSISY